MLTSTLTELDNRTNDGISISLLWDSESNATYIEIEDLRSDSVDTFPVSGENAADAFAHPFVYLASARCNNHPGFSVKV